MTPLMLPVVTEADQIGPYQYFTLGSIAGIRLIESLPKKMVMSAMRGFKNQAFLAILEAMGPKTNHNWIAGMCVERAQDMGWIDDDEADRLQRKYS